MWMIQNYNLDVHSHKLIGKVGGQLTLVTNDVDKIKKKLFEIPKRIKKIYILLSVWFLPLFSFDLRF